MLYCNFIHPRWSLRSLQPESRLILCQGAAAPHRVHVLKWEKQNKIAARAENPPLICVHGLTRMAYDFVDIAQHVSATRDVYSFSMAGRGESDWLSDPMQYTYPTYVADCLQIIRDEIKATQVDWLGTSMGGLIGMWVASLDSLAIHSASLVESDASAPALVESGATGPALIRRLVLNDIGPFLPLSAVQRIAQYAGRAAQFPSIEEAERYCRVVYADFGIKTDAQWRFFAEKTVRKVEGGYALHYDTSNAKVFGDIKEDVSVWPMYESIMCPTLLLRGARSDVLSNDIAEQMTQRGPKAKLVTFENCGHAPALMDIDQIKTVEEFLS